jgi:hypothetical protein
MKAALIMLCCMLELKAPNCFIPFTFSIPKHSLKDSCFLDIIIIGQFDFGRNAENILRFQHISSKIRDMEKIVLLIVNLYSHLLTHFYHTVGKAVSVLGCLPSLDMA